MVVLSPPLQVVMEVAMCKPSSPPTITTMDRTANLLCRPVVFQDPAVMGTTVDSLPRQSTQPLNIPEVATSKSMIVSSSRVQAATGTSKLQRHDLPLAVDTNSAASSASIVQTEDGKARFSSRVLVLVANFTSLNSITTAADKVAAMSRMTTMMTRTTMMITRRKNASVVRRSARSEKRRNASVTAVAVTTAMMVEVPDVGMENTEAGTKAATRAGHKNHLVAILAPIMVVKASMIAVIATKKRPATADKSSPSMDAKSKAATVDKSKAATADRSRAATTTSVLLTVATRNGPRPRDKASAAAATAMATAVVKAALAVDMSSHLHAMTTVVATKNLQDVKGTAVVRTRCQAAFLTRKVSPGAMVSTAADARKRATEVVMVAEVAIEPLRGR